MYPGAGTGPLRSLPHSARGPRCGRAGASGQRHSLPLDRRCLRHRAERRVRRGNRIRQLSGRGIMPRMTRHNPAAVHAPSAGYSLGLELEGHRRLLFVSGQVPARADGVLPDGFEAQCEQAWRNVIAVLAAAGLGVEHLVKVNTFLTDRRQIAANRAIRRRMLQGHEPASTTLIAQTLDANWLLEIEAIAAA